MAKIYKLFSNTETSPKTHSLDSTNRLLPVIRKYTEEALEESEKMASKMSYFPKNSPQYKAAANRYDQIVMRWVERIHRLGAVAKGLWLVDFDTGYGYLCWAYPEERVEYYHSYEAGFKNRQRISDLPITPVGPSGRSHDLQSE